MALSLLLPAGCYYGHLALGQTRVLLARESIDSLLADPETPESLRHQFELVSETLSFAESLGLRVDGQYTSYVDWPGDRIVTTVVAAKPGSIEASEFRFPIVGSVPYKGFFSQERAEGEAEGLRAQGMNVCVVPVAAYSTLGWLDDPLTQPMLRYEDGELVEVVLHELVHATVYVDGDADFNEGVADFLGAEASVRFFEARDTGAAAARRARVGDDRQVARALLAYREDVAALYSSGAEQTQRERAQLERDARRALAALPLQTLDAAELARRARLGDACMALRGAYAGDLDKHQALFAELGGDLSAYVERLVAAGDAEDARAAFFENGARRD